MDLRKSGRILGAEEFVERKNCVAVVINEGQTIITRRMIEMSRVVSIEASRSEMVKM